ncbi:hypothetical protein JCM9534A_77490 [Catenuloplanes indicus JCM 9534]
MTWYFSLIPRSGIGVGLGGHASLGRSGTIARTRAGLRPGGATACSRISLRPGRLRRLTGFRLRFNGGRGTGRRGSLIRFHGRGRLRSRGRSSRSVRGRFRGRDPGGLRSRAPVRLGRVLWCDAIPGRGRRRVLARLRVVLTVRKHCCAPFGERRVLSAAGPRRRAYGRVRDRCCRGRPRGRCLVSIRRLRRRSGQ